jgi:hypothetical protein
MTTTSATRGNSVRDSTRTRCAARTHERTTTMRKQRATRESDGDEACGQSARNTRITNVYRAHTRYVSNY